MCIYSNVIIVLVAPEIMIPPVDTVVINGSDAMLNCTVVGDPWPSITWAVSEVNISLLLANNVRIPFDAQGMINNTLVDNMILNSTTMYSSLRFPETASFIAGNYTCRASNVLGNINRTAILTVHGMYIRWYILRYCTLCITTIMCEVAGYLQNCGWVVIECNHRTFRVVIE